MAEFAPPPLDARPEAKVKLEGGMVKLEGGMAEFAPPPLDAGPDKKK